MTTGVTAVSGREGKIVIDDVQVARCTSWSVNPTAAESAWGDCASAGYTSRKRARRDATGSIEGKFDTDTPFYDLFEDGDIVKIVLWVTATEYWVFPSALITGYNISSDMDGQEVVGWSADFGADGIYYRPGEAGAPTETLPA